MKVHNAKNGLIIKINSDDKTVRVWNYGKLTFREIKKSIVTYLDNDTKHFKISWGKL